MQHLSGKAAEAQEFLMSHSARIRRLANITVRGSNPAGRVLSCLLVLCAGQTYPSRVQRTGARNNTVWCPDEAPAVSLRGWSCGLPLIHAR